MIKINEKIFSLIQCTLAFPCEFQQAPLDDLEALCCVFVFRGQETVERNNAWCAQVLEKLWKGLRMKKRTSRQSSEHPNNLEMKT